MNIGWGLPLSVNAGPAHMGSVGFVIRKGLAYILHATWTFAFAYRYLKVNSGEVVRD